MKRCKRCLQEKELSSFRPVGIYFHSYCRICENLNKCERSKKNRKAITETARKYRQEHLASHRESQRKYLSKKRIQNETV